MTALALTVAGAVLIGVSLGLLGGGGSILAVPLLVYVAGLPAKEAIATSLLVVGATSAVGVLPHARAHRVRWRTGLIFGLAGMTGAYAGGRLAEFVPASVLLTAFALMMLATAVAMIRGRRPVEGRPTPHELPVPRVILDGVVVGLVTGLVGAGGGFLVVPALALLGGLPMPVAVGTSLVVIAMKSLAGLAGYLSSVQIDWRLAGAVTAAAIVGSLIGGRLASRVPEDVLRRAFGWFVVVMGVFVLARQLPPIAGLALAILAAAGTVTVAVWGRRRRGHSGQQRLGRPVRQRIRTGVER
ncbi:sulfite exporter TauE/SafE family protein [Micromonospora sp. WMMD980]|uniref:sulfite exporter TauE/SafE family protein n=1 Tax=Micromonospora sp. WMMD980 TaxID=3016088 RepID=UPI002417AC50|nr:sulfite exporter TauE/SafE family protein [Micromonospora sp. WMMD980]MDG4801304.1 sulfite exporter TauE/SafE family protein [Micromonospora sp. WMMD980]